MTDKKHYPMPVLTEQEHKTLVIRADELIQTYGGDLETLLRIALSALTAPKAEPVAWLASSVNGQWPDYIERDKEVVERITQRGLAKFEALYTAPPVLSDLLPDLYDIPDGHDLTSCMAGAAWYEQQLKRRLTLIESGKWKVVPAEPTQQMLASAAKYHEGQPYLPFSLYISMLAAAPEGPC